MIKIGQKRIWNDVGMKFQVVEKKSDGIWIVQYENGRHDVHEEVVIKNASEII